MGVRRMGMGARVRGVVRILRLKGCVLVRVGFRVVLVRGRGGNGGERGRGEGEEWEKKGNDGMKLRDLGIWICF